MRVQTVRDMRFVIACLPGIPDSVHSCLLLSGRGKGGTLVTK